MPVIRLASVVLMAMANPAAVTGGAVVTTTLAPVLLVGAAGVIGLGMIAKVTGII